MRDRIRELIGIVFELPVDRVPRDASPDNLPDWDSLRHLELMLEVELAFGVRISAEDMADLASAEAIEDYLHEHGAVAAE
jgi:acyl carrier protein